MTTPTPTTHDKLQELARLFLAGFQQQFGDVAETEFEREMVVDRLLAALSAAAGVALSVRRHSRGTDTTANALLNSALRLWTRRAPAGAQVYQMPRVRPDHPQG